MPQSITNNSGTKTYRYDATGKRTMKQGDPNDIDYYLDGVILDALGNVKSYQTADGYATPFYNDGLTIVVEHFYNIKDWLGTNRGVIDQTGAVLNANDNYPFGLRLPGRAFTSSNAEGERYQFTGHEFDAETNYDYHGARYYNKELGRYMSVDPLAHQFFAWSTYNYTMNNPINMIDPDGRGPTDWFLSQKTGQLVYVKGKSEITQEDLNKVGSPYDVSDYKRVGGDDMFGKELPITLPGYDGSNFLDRSHLVVDDYGTELLMNYVGFEKAEQVKMVERQILSSGPMGAGEDITSSVYTKDQVDRKIDYVKPKELHKMSDSRVTKWSDLFITTTRAEYSYTKPYGWSMDNYSYFNLDRTRRTAKTVGGMTKTILDQIKDFRKK